MNKHPVVDVVIPTYNEEQNIERLLASISSQQDCSYTVVVVDQSSSDRTAAMARSYGCHVIEVPRAPFYTPPARSRNLGARATNGTILLHLDADMELSSPNTLSTLVSLVAQGHGAVIIHENDLATGFWARCKALERFCYWNTEMESARGVTRELFTLVGGYDEDVSSGEDFFITKLYQKHTRIARDELLVLNHHIGRLSLKQLLGKKFAYGRTAQTYLHKARHTGANSSMDIVRNSMGAYLTNWRLLFRHPALYLCIFPLRVFEFVAVQMGKRASRTLTPETPSKSHPSDCAGRDNQES